MENLEQNGVAETKSSFLHTTTPLSKYLAMLLFVILPFLGGWVGYTYAPEKIVEVKTDEVTNSNVELQEKISSLEERIGILSSRNTEASTLIDKLKSIALLPYPGAPIQNPELKSTLANSINANFTCEEVNEYVSLRKDLGNILFNQIDFSGYTDTDLGFVINHISSCELTTDIHLGIASFSAESEAGTLPPHLFFFLYDSEETVLAVSEAVVKKDIFARLRDLPEIKIDGLMIHVTYSFGDAGHFGEQTIKFDISDWSITDVALNFWSTEVLE